MSLKKDWYCNFADLAAREVEGKTFQRTILNRKSPVSVIAPHGEKIEPSTGTIASALAGEDWNLYRLDSLVKAPHERFHITSTNFDDGECLALIKASEAVISVHGLGGDGNRIDVGGLDKALRNHVVHHLVANGFRAIAVETGSHAATNPDNICNRGKTGKGVQLEITADLRSKLDGAVLTTFVESIRTAAKSPSV